MGRSIDDLLAEGRARRLKYEAERRAEWFAENNAEIPELDLMPDCPICGSCDMEYDEGFYCPGCDVLWDRNGCKGEKSSP